MAQQQKTKGRDRQELAEPKGRVGQEPAEPKGRGGARPGAGRKSGSGAFGEATVPMRVPVSFAPALEEALADHKARVASVKEAGSQVAAVDAKAIARGMAVADGSPSGKPLDIGRLLAERPGSCFAWRASEAIPGLGIAAGDVVVVDRSAEAREGSILAHWGEAGIELSRAPGGRKALGQVEPWGVAVGLARKLES